MDGMLLTGKFSRVPYCKSPGRCTCGRASIRLSVEKGLRLYEIQAASVKALLEDYMRRSPYDFSFQVRRNYTVTMRYVLPSKQVLSVPISFRSVLDGGLSEEYEKGLQSVMDFSLKFGRMTIR